MSDLKTITIDVYPWAVPTDEQRDMFDALPHDQQLKMIEEAVQDGFESGISTKTIADIMAESKASMNAGL